MPLLKSGTFSRSINIGKFVGVGFLNLLTPRGELKMFHGDHLVEIPYSRDARPGEPGFVADPSKTNPQGRVDKKVSFIVPEDAAKFFNLHLKETVEEENERLAKEAQLKKEADEAAAAKKLADEAAKAAEKK